MVNTVSCVLCRFGWHVVVGTGSMTTYCDKGQLIFLPTRMVLHKNTSYSIKFQKYYCTVIITFQLCEKYLLSKLCWASHWMTHMYSISSRFSEKQHIMYCTVLYCTATVSSCTGVCLIWNLIWNVLFGSIIHYNTYHIILMLLTGFGSTVTIYCTVQELYTAAVACCNSTIQGHIYIIVHIYMRKLW